VRAYMHVETRVCMYLFTRLLGTNFHSTPWSHTRAHTRQIRPFGWATSLA